MVVSRGNLASWKKNIVQLRVIDKLKVVLSILSRLYSHENLFTSLYSYSKKTATHNLSPFNIHVYIFPNITEIFVIRNSRSAGSTMYKFKVR
jgi:hypothetical protein